MNHYLHYQSKKLSLHKRYREHRLHTQQQKGMAVPVALRTSKYVEPSVASKLT